jgi:proteasome lid subunit RPN8/RPN11
MKRIRLTVAPSVLRQFRRAAIISFPKEHCAFLIGHDVEGSSSRDVNIQEIWTPDDVQRYGTRFNMNFQGHWFEEATVHAKEAGMDLVGAVHSHPWTREEIMACSGPPDCSESEADGEYFCWDKVNGICLLTQRADMKISARFRWWGPRAPVEIAPK